MRYLTKIASRDTVIVLFLYYSASDKNDVGTAPSRQARVYPLLHDIVSSKQSGVLSSFLPAP